MSNVQSPAAVASSIGSIGAHPRDEETPRPFGFRWFIPELLRHKAAWRDILAASFALQLAGLATPLLTQVVIDRVVAHQTINTLIAIAFGLVILVGFNAAMGWARQGLLLRTGNRIDAVLTNRVFEHLLALPARYFESRPTGTLVARLNGIESIREFVAGAAMMVLLDGPFLVVFMAAMLYYSVPLTMVVAVLLGLMLLLSLVVAPLVRERLNRQFLLGARNQAFLTEYIAGMDTVKSLQMEPHLGRRYQGLLSEWLSAGYRTRQLHNGYSVAVQSLEQAVSLSVLCLGAWEVMRNPGFTVGMLMAFQMFASRLAQPLTRLASLWQEFQQAGIAVRRLGDLMNAPAEPRSAQRRPVSADLASMEVESLYFRHSERATELFGGLSFRIEPGQCALILGPSGCGKSTLARLLQGIYLPTSGRIRLDGRDVRSIPVDEWRSGLGVVPQETVLFSGSVADNVAMGKPEASIDEIVQACRLAELHEVIDSLPEGYDTLLGEHGVGLSGGQRQRLAIARAMLRRPKVLLLDEATSQLDAATAAALYTTVNRLKGRLTLVIVSHEQPAALDVDVCIDLAGERGRHGTD